MLKFPRNCRRRYMTIKTATAADVMINMKKISHQDVPDEYLLMI